MITVNTIYTCIMGSYEPLKEPSIITPGWRYICITDQDLKSNVWNIIKIESTDNSRKKAREIKALFFNYINSKYSIYIDGSFQVNCDINNFWNKYFTSPFSLPAHPIRCDITDEYNAIIEGKRGGAENVKEQLEYYRKIIPSNNGLFTSGILLREHTSECIEICTEWFKETSRWSLRDQMSLAMIATKYKLHGFDYKYNQQEDFKYFPHKEWYDPITNTTHF